MPTNWTDEPQGVDDTNTHEWVAIRKGTTGAWGKFTDPVLWSRQAVDGKPGIDGRDGQDGSGLEWIYRLTNTNNAPDTPTTTPAQDATDDFEPTGWTDNPSGVSEAMQFEWLSVRTGTTGNWGKFSAPSLYARYGIQGEPGEDGPGIEFVFFQTSSSSPPSRPASTAQQLRQNNYVPAGWTDNAQGVTSALPFEYASARVGTRGMWGEFQTPALWARYAADGTGIQYVYRATPTETTPATPTATNAQRKNDNYIPDDWQREPPDATITTPYIWVSQRTGTNGDWGAWSAPALWSRTDITDARTRIVYPWTYGVPYDDRNTASITPNDRGAYILWTEKPDFLP